MSAIAIESFVKASASPRIQVLLSIGDTAAITCGISIRSAVKFIIFRGILKNLNRLCFSERRRICYPHGQQTGGECPSRDLSGECEQGGYYLERQQAIWNEENE